MLEVSVGQLSLSIMMESYKLGKLPCKIMGKMCYNPAILYRIKNRGFIREGYSADLVLVDLDASYTVSTENILYKCRWSPLEGTTFHSSINKTFVNGNLVYDNGRFNEIYKGMSLS